MSVNKLIASCGQEVKIHEWSNGKTVYNLSPSSGPNSFFKNISWSISGKKLLAIPTGSKPIIIKRTVTLKDTCFTLDIMNEIEPPEIGIFSKNSEEYVTFGSANGEVYVFDIYTNAIAKIFTCLPSPVVFMDYTPRDTFLAAGCKSGQIFLYNTNGDVCSSFFVPRSQSLSAMLFHPSRESYLAAASKEGVVAIWDVQTNTAKFVAKNHSKYITDLAISATEELLATVGLDRQVYIYDLRSKEIVFNKVFSSELSAVACSLAGEEFAIGTTRGRIFVVDKRQPDYTKGSISAQKSSIRSICFCNDLDEGHNTKLRESMSEPILTDNVSSDLQISNGDSDTKIPEIGEFTAADGKSMISRIPGGMDEQPNNAREWVEQLPDNVGDKHIPVLQVIEETYLNTMRQEIVKCSRDIVHNFMEEINAQFLKIRMGVSREFCRIEQNNNKRWQDFNITLLKLAGCEETAKEAENEQSEILTNDSQRTLGCKPESLYSPPKTKLSPYSLDN